MNEFHFKTENASPHSIPAIYERSIHHFCFEPSAPIKRFDSLVRLTTVGPASHNITAFECIRITAAAVACLRAIDKNEIINKTANEINWSSQLFLLIVY